METLGPIDRQIYIALRRLLLKMVDLIERRVEMEPTTQDIREQYARRLKS